ncbi:MAG: GNAT family N-acetyltransferase, partial [Lactobacillus iners]|nr:GNAT family N-acetyltransferase [Lactobacillus iners]
KVLITCDDDNIGSIKVIENNGGILENKVKNSLSRGNVITRRYWINL